MTTICGDCGGTEFYTHSGECKACVRSRPAPRTCRMGTRHSSGDGMTRKRSLRWHQAKVDEVLTQVEKGRMSPADGLKRVNIIKASAEIHIVQRQLELQGIGAPVDITPAPEEEFKPSPVIPYRSQRATVTEAVGPQGATSTKTVVIDSSGRDDEAIDRAEVEALT